MPEKVEYDAQTKLIRVRAWGAGTIEEWIASRKQVVELHNEHGAEQLLVDARDQDSAPSTLDIFDFGSDWPPRIRTAILVGERTKEDVEFLETVAFNRGKQMRVFDNEVDALNWLREQA